MIIKGIYYMQRCTTNGWERYEDVQVANEDVRCRYARTPGSKKEIWHGRGYGKEQMKTPIVDAQEHLDQEKRYRADG